MIVRYRGDAAATGGSITEGTGSASGFTLHTFTTVGASALDFSALDMNQRLGVTLSGELSGSGDLTFSGPGTLTLSGSNSYTGATVVEAGTLALADDGSIASSSEIQVASGAVFDVSGLNTTFTLANGQTLGGSGSIVGDMVIAGGTLHSRRNSVGALAVGNLTLQDGAIIDWEFEDSDTFDQFLAQQDTSLSIASEALITLNISSIGSGAITLGDTFLLYDGDVNGFSEDRFNIVNSSAWAGGFAISDGGSLVLTAIPEPRAYAVLSALAVLVLALFRRRNKA